MTRHDQARAGLPAKQLGQEASEVLPPDPGQDLEVPRSNPSSGDVGQSRAQQQQQQGLAPVAQHSLG
jgi:hypothetical protein